MMNRLNTPERIIAIPTNFRIPEGYCQRHVMRDGEAVFEVYADWRESRSHIFTSVKGGGMPNQSRALDFCGESVARIRAECEVVK